MTLHVTQLEGKSEHRSFRLTKPGSGASSQVRDDVVFPSERARALLAVAAAKDVASGGIYSPGPAGVQVWSGAWNAPTGGHGTAEHLGSVDWSWDTPTGYVTVYRVMVTTSGTAAGLTTDALLRRVLGLAGVELPEQVTQTARVQLPLPRNPFRSEGWAPPLLTSHQTRT